MKPTLIIDPNGTKIWRLNGKLHREDGPAMELSDGTKFWFLNGQRHRKDGPAVEWSDGTRLWCLNDQYLTNRELLSEKMKINYPELYGSYVVYQIMEN